MSGSVKRLPPLSVRLSASEREMLQSRAGGVPLSTFMKHAALGGPISAGTRTSGSDRAALAKILGQLGASALATSLRSISAAAENGSLYVDEAIASELRRSCDQIDEIHRALMRALYGGRGMAAPTIVPKSLDDIFNSLNSTWRAKP